MQAGSMEFSKWIRRSRRHLPRPSSTWIVIDTKSLSIQAKVMTTYKTLQVNGLTIFYREAGPVDAPTILFLHGFPSSSRMFENLFSLLSARYHLVAPDYPGFGYSDVPDPHLFDYTFDHLAAIMDSFTA